MEKNSVLNEYLQGFKLVWKSDPVFLIACILALLMCLLFLVEKAKNLF